MGNEQKSELKVLEQIRNLLILQILKNKIATNTEVSRAIDLTPGRISQLVPKHRGKKTKKGK